MWNLPLPLLTWEQVAPAAARQTQDHFGRDGSERQRSWTDPRSSERNHTGFRHGLSWCTKLLSGKGTGCFLSGRVPGKCVKMYNLHQEALQRSSCWRPDLRKFASLQQCCPCGEAQRQQKHMFWPKEFSPLISSRWKTLEKLLCETQTHL